MRILIELPTWLGDSVMASPAIINIFKNFQGNYQVSFMGSKTALDYYQNFPKIETNLVLKKKNIFKDLSEISKLGNFDYAISFRSSFRSKIYLFFSKSKNKFQFLNFKFNKLHQVEKYNAFINNIFNTDYKPGPLMCFENIPTNHVKKRLIGINPGAAYGDAKRWPSSKFVSLIEKFLKKDNLVVLFGGAKEIDSSKKIFDQFDLNLRKNLINLTGKTSISDLIREISSLSLFITGDSGPMHIAAALKIPTISIFGPTRLTETSQWKNKENTIIRKDLTCQPCMKRTCPLGHHNCMNLIDVEEVYKKSQDLINLKSVNQ